MDSTRTPDKSDLERARTEREALGLPGADTTAPRQGNAWGGTVEDAVRKCEEWNKHHPPTRRDTWEPILGVILGIIVVVILMVAFAAAMNF